MRRRYPFDALAGLKKQRTVDRAREKAAITSERLAADARAAEAAGETTRARSKLRNAVETEAERMRSGRGRAADLAQADRYRTVAERRLREHEEAEARATRERDTLVRREEAAASRLVGAHEAERAISDHRTRFRSEQARAAERRDDDASDEAFLSFRSKTRRAE